MHLSEQLILTSPTMKTCFRIGVDVGGTNTDSALACANYCKYSENGSQEPEVKIIASSKTPTTADITTGICTAVRNVLETPNVDRSDILSINIGTTHFINAIVQADRSKLARVAVLRLCGPFCREVSPFADFPAQLRSAIEGPVGYLNGGLEIDGRTIKHIDVEEVTRHAYLLRESGITTVVVCGVFSPLDTSDLTQEEQVRQILEDVIPGVDVVCSRDIGRVGFLERENAAILNATILRFGRETIRFFQDAINSLDLDCALYLTQNDGTVLDAESASRAPIRTFSSGATNSLIGALFLSGIHKKSSGIDLQKSQIIMVDIGGTTSDFAALSPSGFPRQSPATVSIGGVRTAFSMPEVVSIGLGGGSKVLENSVGDVTVGPSSVGYLLPTESLCFGGSVLTATDIVVAAGLGEEIQSCQNSRTLAWKSSLRNSVVNKARLAIKRQIEQGIERMKTSEQEVILLLVGGGSIILMDALDNVAKCIQPEFSNVANAVGAAIAKISGEIDNIQIPNGRSTEQIRTELCTQATQLAVKNGALPSSVRIVEFDLIPLQYVANGASRAIVKAVGELGWQKCGNLKSKTPSLQRDSLSYVKEAKNTQPLPYIAPQIQNYESYTPSVSKATGEWFVSPTDLAFIAEGAGVLGTGGGGSVHTAYLNSLEILRSVGEGKMRIVDQKNLRGDSKIGTVAYIGAPSVSNERLTGNNELPQAAEKLSKYLDIHGLDGVLAAEMGGSNGMRQFAMAATMDIPIIDADTMGRAFPKVDMSLPYVYQMASAAPAVLSDARGNIQIIAAAEDAHRFENMVRVAAIELGLYSALCLNPLDANVVRNYCCHRSVSLAWYIGREIYRARQKKADIVKALLSAVPGSFHVYCGKIVDVTRKVQGGWTIGTATLNLDESESSTVVEKPDSRPMIIQYQNEYLFAALVNEDNTHQAICTTPDLIAVLDTNGSALGSHELRYGLRVNVIAMPAHPLWKSEQGMAAGGPKAFGLEMEYTELENRWVQPRSVIEEFGV